MEKGFRHGRWQQQNKAQPAAAKEQHAATTCSPQRNREQHTRSLTSKAKLCSVVGLNTSSSSTQQQYKKYDTTTIEIRLVAASPHR
jgi:4-hydroxy-3-methylbut-2-enyl diphosphate reductase IspH